MNPESIDNNFIDRELDNLRVHIAPHAAPPQVETAILNAFANKQRAAANIKHGWAGNIGQWLAPGTAIAASVGMSVWMLLSISVGTPPAQIADNDAPFFALQSLEQIALEPNPRLIETQIPKLMLASMGVAVSPEIASESLRAEMLVSAAGQPLALRFSQR
jgi:hypothetical protein